MKFTAAILLLLGTAIALPAASESSTSSLVARSPEIHQDLHNLGTDVAAKPREEKNKFSNWVADKKYQLKSYAGLQELKAQGYWDTVKAAGAQAHAIHEVQKRKRDTIPITPELLRRAYNGELGPELQLRAVDVLMRRSA